MILRFGLCWFLVFFSCILSIAFSSEIKQSRDGIHVSDSFQVAGVNVYSSLMTLVEKCEKTVFRPRAYYKDLAKYEENSYFKHSGTLWENFPDFLLTFEVEYPSAVLFKSSINLTGLSGTQCGLRLVVDGVADALGALYSVKDMEYEDENIALQRVLELEPGPHNVTVEVGGPSSLGEIRAYVGNKEHSTISVSAFVVPRVDGVVYGNVEGSADTIFNGADGFGVFVPFEGMNATFTLAEESAVIADGAISFQACSPRFVAVGLGLDGDPEYGAHSKPSHIEHNTLHFTRTEILPAGTHSYTAFHYIPTGHEANFQGSTDTFSNAKAAPNEYFQRLSFIAIPTRYGVHAEMAHGTMDLTTTSASATVPGLSISAWPEPAIVPHVLMTYLNMVADPRSPGAYSIFRINVDGAYSPPYHFQSGTITETDMVHVQHFTTLTPNQAHSVQGTWVAHGTMASWLAISRYLYIQQLCVFMFPAV